MIWVVVAEEDCIKGWEIDGFACRECDALWAHDAKFLLEYGIEQSAKARRKLGKDRSVTDPCCAESCMAGALGEERRWDGRNGGVGCIRPGELPLEAIAAT